MSKKIVDLFDVVAFSFDRSVETFQKIVPNQNVFFCPETKDPGGLDVGDFSHETHPTHFHTNQRRYR